MHMGNDPVDGERVPGQRRPDQPGRLHFELVRRRLPAHTAALRPASSIHWSSTATARSTL
jgi:hypothetical protein